jgi:hypothetical protein
MGDVGGVDRLLSSSRDLDLDRVTINCRDWDPPKVFRGFVPIKATEFDCLDGLELMADATFWEIFNDGFERMTGSRSLLGTTDVRGEFGGDNNIELPCPWIGRIGGVSEWPRSAFIVFTCSELTISELFSDPEAEFIFLLFVREDKNWILVFTPSQT